MVAIGSGVSMGYLGNSHFGLEDISIISSMPDIPVYQPSDCIELFDMVHYLANLDGPAYLRLTGIAPSPPIHSANYAFSPTKLDVLSSGSQLLIISSGSVSANVVSACKGLDPELIYHVNVPVYSPLPSSIIDLFSRFSTLLVVEEHSSFGGLSSAISNHVVSNRLPLQIHTASLPPSFLPSGDYPHLLASSGLDASSLNIRIKDLLS